MLDTELDAVAGAPPLVAYCRQPIVARDELLIEVLRRSDEAAALALFARLRDAILAVVSPRLGLDAELSNWVVRAGRPVYLDTSTPLLRDYAGREEVDVDLFFAALPALMRPLVRRWFLAAILDRFYTPRALFVDLLACMYEQPTPHLVAPFLRSLEGRFTPAITEAELRRYFAANEGAWRWLR